ncbi:MAG: type I-C CRISPR-associated protein Cas8c/Csd1 [Acidobacteria bacterium]|nr:type I-C CRISPR-associated protein Cas8c/Csd1 [Acidobacteriota bacterium]MBW4046249.1 type I-C CRISPR-associated protein Cas8c/Csd1 [Acidobacteriota bacterium]
MSWIQKLYETYDRCAGQPQFDTNPLMPIDHAEQQVHIEITLNGSGKFRSASVVSKETTFIPATEGSAGRTSAPVAHGLTDKLEYVAPEQNGSPIHKDTFVEIEATAKTSKKAKKEKDSPHSLYVNQLRSWVASEPDPHVQAVLSYVEGGTIIADLLQHHVLQADAAGDLLTRWPDSDAPPALFKVLTATAGERNQRAAVVRWIVELREPEGAAQLWKNQNVQFSWQRFVAKQAKEAGLCMVTGDWLAPAANHPKRLRHGADGAKLISSNDSSGYTYRGRFALPEQAYGIGSSTTQKAHNALRWLLSRQGYQNSDQAIVAWAVSGKPIPQVVADSEEIKNRLMGTTIETAPEIVAVTERYRGDAGQLFAKEMNKLIRGYATNLGEREDIVVMALDSATPGRMAIIYYRELQASEFLERIQDWHEHTAWPQNMGKDRRFIGAPAPRDIAEAAYGRRVDDKLTKSTVERLLPCIVDGRPIPRDLVTACAQQAVNPAGKEHWEWERCLGIACALVRGSRRERNYKMALEEDRNSRDYLFGRLLAIAEKIEGYALYLAKETRGTTAERLMQRFSDHPSATWRTIELALRPYMQRLQGSRPAALYVWKSLLDDVISRFQDEDFTRPGRLDAEFLLGYHCQRAALRWEDSKVEAKVESCQEPQLA